MPVSDQSTAPHYIWQSDCDGWRLADFPDLAVTQERMPAGRSELAHRHQKARQVFYVLGGTLEIRLEGGAEHKLEAGQSLSVAPGIGHLVHAPGPDPAEFLVISAPSTRGDREPL